MIDPDAELIVYILRIQTDEGLCRRALSCLVCHQSEDGPLENPEEGSAFGVVRVETGRGSDHRWAKDADLTDAVPRSHPSVALSSYGGHAGCDPPSGLVPEGGDSPAADRTSSLKPTAYSLQPTA